MLPFEKDVIDLLKINDIKHSFNTFSRLIITDSLNIQLIPNCSGISGLKNVFDASLNPKIHTVYLWQDIYQSHTQVVNSRILSLLGVSKRIYARSTVIKSIPQLELNDFLKTNHLNVITKVKYRYGMFSDKKLVAVAAFGRSCPIQNEGKTFISHELIRFCSLLNHTVVGGLSKFIQYFINNIHPEHIMTYVDREWSTGKSYQKLEFTIDGYTPPQSFWLSPDDCSRHYASDALKASTPEQLVEEGWKEVKNLGNIKLVKFI